MNLGRNKIWIISIVVSSIAGCVTFSGYPSSFTLEFPATEDLGELWLMEDVNCFSCGAGEKDLGHATGEYQIRLPAAHWFVSLRMPANAARLLPHLARPSLSNIGDIDLRGSDVKDEDLRFIAGINLRSINLSRTRITGAGLKYLKPNQKWTFVDLQSCDELDPQFLAHFRGWKRSTIRLVPYKWTGDTYSVAEGKLIRPRETDHL